MGGRLDQVTILPIAGNRTDADNVISDYEERLDVWDRDGVISPDYTPTT